MDSPIPSHYFIGEVSSDGDSFFNSVAKCLEQVRRGTFSAKSLRQECKKYAQHCAALVDTIGDQNIHGYIVQIENCQNECTSPISGRPEVEGKIINKVFNVKIYIAEKQGSDNLPGEQETQSWLHKIVDELGYRPVESIDYEVSETIYIIDEGNLNFKPILKNIQRESPVDIVRLCTEKPKVEELRQRQTETYNRKKGAAGAGGHFYEIKLSMLFMLRLQETDEFYLASNMENTGAFDDVVFNYQMKGSKKTIFLQAKYRDKQEAGHITIDNLKSQSGAFSLNKYFDSFREIKRNFKPSNDPIFNGKFEDCGFIIFTNYVLSCTSTEEGRWVNKAGDGVVVSKEKESKQLNVHADINKDIIANLSRSPVQRLAKEIYDYTLGCKVRHVIQLTEIFQEYHIFLANEVFIVNKDPKKSKFRDDIHKVESLRKELMQITKCEEKEFTVKLKQTKVKLCPNFGNSELEGINCEDLVMELARAIVQSESDIVEIDNPSDDINKLANNVLVKAGEPSHEGELVKFTEKELTGQAKEYMIALKATINEISCHKEFDLPKIRFQIKGFPTFSLPSLDQDMTKNEVTEFLRNLEFVLYKTHENKLDGIIKAEMKKAYGVDDEESDAIFDRVNTQVEEWWKSSNNYITKDTKFFENAKTSISYFQLSAAELFSRRGIEIAGMEFNETVVTEFKAFINQGKQVFNIIAEKGTTLLSSIKICQTLDSKFTEHKYKFIDLIHLLNIRDHAIRVFQSKGKNINFLLVESNSSFQTHGKWDEEHLDKLCTDLLTITKDNSKKRIILITEKDDRLANRFKTVMEKFHEKCDNTNLNDLTPDSQKKLLDKEITLQGKTIQMKDLIGTDDAEANTRFASQTIQRLITNETLTINTSPQRLSDLEAAYAHLQEEMTFDNLVQELQTSCEKKTMFVISGIFQPKNGALHDELMRYLQITDQNVETDLKQRIAILNERYDDKTIIIIPNHTNSDPLRDFKTICSKIQSKIVYWVEAKHGHVYLQQVHNPNFYIKRRFSYRQKTALKLELIWQKTPSAIFIFTDFNDWEKVQKLVLNLHERFLKHFEENCNNGTILFVTSELIAESQFENLKGENKQVHWLKIDGNNKKQFLWHGSHGTIAKTVLESDLLVQQNCQHVFIFSNDTDKMKVIDMIEKSCQEKRKQFTIDCMNKNIQFSLTETENKILNQDGGVHWLKIDGNDDEQLLWEKSQGTLEHIRHFIDDRRSENKLYTEVEFNKQINDKVVIIADEPGMGKTTSLTSISEQMLDKNWIFRINFLDCNEAIKELPANLTLEGVCNFITKATSTDLKDDFDINLFLCKLAPKEHQLWKILILFDGFDEISEHRQDGIIPLLKFIAFQTSARLWVTTRLHKTECL